MHLKLFVSRRRYIRDMTEAMQSYRWERDEAERRAVLAETKRDEAFDRLVKAKILRDSFSSVQRLRVVIDCDDLLVYYRPVDDEYTRLAHRIIMSLERLDRDYRGDLRQTEMQRLLI